MIEELSVRNFALIDNLTLSFDKGFTVLTGETGAGKSIIVGSISFLLGSKADTDIIRSETDEASVSAVISIRNENTDTLEWLNRREIAPEDGAIVVRRTVKNSGRNSIYIQNIPVSRNELADFMGLLFDLHGQHSHESLLKKESHRVYLDSFSGLSGEVSDFNRLFTELSEKHKALDSLNRSEKEREERLDYLSFAVDEISKAAPRNGEIKELETETQRLGDFEKLSFHVNAASSALFDDAGLGDSAISLLTLGRRIRASLEAASSIDATLVPVLKRLEDIFFEAEDLAREFRNYRDQLNFDPGRLEEAEERLSLLYKLKKKYSHFSVKRNDSPSSKDDSSKNDSSKNDSSLDDRNDIFDEEGILSYKIEAENEIETLSGAGENRDKLKSEITALEKVLVLRASNISAKRLSGAKKLGDGITKILYRLGMPKAKFDVRVKPKTKEGGQGLLYGPWGSDDVEFLISANTGEPLKELARIASGGELSRVMLAIKTILYGNDSSGINSDAETLVFDEIDTGIGGEVALSVGEYLSMIGRGKQIFCVTHLASIAVRADNHMKVEKKIVSTGDDRTVTDVLLLNSNEKRHEIARMLAGDSGDAALAHADDLLAKYGRE